MTLKETITGQLLDSVNDPSVLEQVFKQYRNSKGPFYLAFAEATHQVEQQIQDLSWSRSDLKGQRDQVQADLTVKEKQRRTLVDEVQKLVQQREKREKWLTENQGLLDRAGHLEQMGFGEDQLDQLHRLLIQVAQDTEPSDVVTEFFRVAELLGHVTVLELEIVQAEGRSSAARAEAERWEEAAKSAADQARAGQAVVQTTESLLDQGIRAADLMGWHQLVNGAGLSVAELDRELQRFGGIAELTAAREARAGELQLEISRLEGELKGLKKQRKGLEGAVKAIKDQTASELRKVGKQVACELKRSGKEARAEIQSLTWAAAEHAQLREESATLREYLQIASAIGSDDRRSGNGCPGR